MRIYLYHLKKAKYCSRGSRAFFLSRGWDWADFVKNGRDANDFLETKDVMAIKLVEIAKNGK